MNHLILSVLLMSGPAQAHHLAGHGQRVSLDRLQKNAAIEKENLRTSMSTERKDPTRKSDKNRSAFETAKNQTKS